eukprot:CAMPEP_0195308570 /NCGR_PEP_ID=MMETSP0707-20130614/38294_1 /TAXON_ID=33640 /ORGANISM="Asterionellopsis glacialis, Strain CCMP134" /LENGTH=125 /DNA_ID=CAMNT_0040372849 /DNA_START=1 /DNA_END=375 /DNA_ORIENTATION=-
MIFSSPDDEDSIESDDEEEDDKFEVAIQCMLHAPPTSSPSQTQAKKKRKKRIILVARRDKNAKREQWFPHWSHKKSNGKNASPQELLILGAYWYSGCGFTFDDIKESTTISKEVHKDFSQIHKNW